MSLEHENRGLQTRTWKTPSEYHNATVDQSKNNEGNERAFQMAFEGLRNYPFDIDLLADAVLYAPVGKPSDWLFEESAGNLSRDRSRELVGNEDNELMYAEDFCIMLLALYDRWNWRAFCYVIDYLKERRVAVLSDSKEISATLHKAIDIAKDFTDRFPNEERAFNELAEAYIANNEQDKAEQLLRTIILDKHLPEFPVAQCCTTLMDMLMEKGNRVDAIRVARVGQMGTARTQPSASLGYFVYCEALMMDSLLMSDYLKECGFKLPDAHEGQVEEWEDSIGLRKGTFAERAKETIARYELAKVLLAGRSYVVTIQQRVVLLRSLFGVVVQKATKATQSDAKATLDIAKVEQDDTELTPEEALFILNELIKKADDSDTDQ